MNNREKTGTKLKAWFKRKRVSFVKNSYIVRELVKRNIKVQYRNSAIGVLWTILNPLLNMIVMFVVFSNILPGNKEDSYYALYLLCGTITFSLMRSATTQSMTSIVNNRGLLTKNKISQYVFPISHNIGAVVNFGFSMVALLAVMLVIAIKNNSFEIFSANLLLVFVMLPALFLFSYGLSLVLAAFYVFFRDIQHFYNVFLTLWTYLTPMFYKPDSFFESAQNGDIAAQVITVVIKANPMYRFIEYFRDIAYRCASGAVANSLPGLEQTLIMYGWGIGAFLFGTLIFTLTRPKFIYNI